MKMFCSRHSIVYRDRSAISSRPALGSCVATSEARYQARSSPASCDCASKLDCCRTSEEMTPSAAFCQPARCPGRALCQIKLPRVAPKISAAAIVHFRNRFFQCGTRLTFTPARMFSRKSGGGSTAESLSVIAASNVTESRSHCSNIGSRRACSSASEKRESLAS